FLSMSPRELYSAASAYFSALQERLCAALEAFDGRTRFTSDRWERPGGGGGLTRVLLDGKVFEKAGVNFSAVHGLLSTDVAPRIPGEGNEFSATGTSLVLHSLCPMVPAVHANFRFLARGEKAWFGGGADLTPTYPYLEDVVHFHRVWKGV